MEDQSQEEHVLELRESGEAIGKLAENPDAFRAAVEAFRATDAEKFQSVLGELDLLGRCHLICRWICSKHCVFVCRKLCGPIEGAKELDIDEMLEFARHTQRIAGDESVLKRLLNAVEKEDEKAWTSLIERLELQRFCHQLCHWLCGVRCRRVCRLVCPPPPLITKVAHIPTNQINPQGLGSGPSIPPGHTPPDNKPAGDGDHPFGGLAHIEGNFLSVVGATHYKVEWASNPAGTWTPILTAMDDLRLVGLNLVSYKRVPDAAGWYAVSDIGLLGPTQLTDWPTPAPDGLYYLKLTAKTGGGTEFASTRRCARRQHQADRPGTGRAAAHRHQTGRPRAGVLRDGREGRGTTHDHGGGDGRQLQPPDRRPGGRLRRRRRGLLEVLQREPRRHRCPRTGNRHHLGSVGGRRRTVLLRAVHSITIA